MDFNEKMVRVNGVLLSKFQNQTVCLLGRVNHVDPNGSFFQLTTSDDQNVTVRLKQGLTEVPSDLVEVQGVVDKGDIQCLNYVVLNHQGPKPFDMQSYDKAIRYMHKFPECYTIWGN